MPGEGCGRESQGEQERSSKRPPKVKGSREQRLPRAESLRRKDRDRRGVLESSVCIGVGAEGVILSGLGQGGNRIGRSPETGGITAWRALHRTPKKTSGRCSMLSGSILWRISSPTSHRSLK